VIGVTDPDTETRRATVRLALIEARDNLARATEDRAALIREGSELGIGATELAQLAGLSRASIYNLTGAKPFNRCVQCGLLNGNHAAGCPQRTRPTDLSPTTEEPGTDA
jgi:hypothetical protein